MRFENACPKSGVSPPLQMGAQNYLLSTTSHLNGKFKGLYLQNETDMHNRASALTTATTPISSQNIMKFDPQTA